MSNANYATLPYKEMGYSLQVVVVDAKGHVVNGGDVTFHSSQPFHGIEVGHAFTLEGFESHPIKSVSHSVRHHGKGDDVKLDHWIFIKLDGSKSV